MSIKPMLAGKFKEAKATFPCYIQPKFDGIRTLSIKGVATSRTLKPIPNTYIQKFFAEYNMFLDGWDGEIIVGSPTAKNVYRDTMSGVMSESGEPDFKYYVFDNYMYASQPYFERRDAILGTYIRMPEAAKGRVEFCMTHLVNSLEELMKFEASMVSQGYEGAIVRSPKSPYKYGRSSPTGGHLLKLKRFLDDEATIIGFEELLSNQNESTKDALGHSKRSSHQANKVGANTLGALLVHNSKGQQFSIGTGFDQALRKEIWENKDKYDNVAVKYKYVEVGGYDLPRFPVFIGFRKDGV